MIPKIAKTCFFLGLLLIVVGACLAIFTNLTVSMGADGIVMISLIIGLGLLLSIPSKIYLMLLFFEKAGKINND